MDEYDTINTAQPKTQDHSSPASSLQSQSSLRDAEFQEYIRQYPFAAEPTYFTRPNRYYGPASTWRSWTAEERSIVDALDITRARDLSVHLIKAFALKQRCNQSAVFQKGAFELNSRDEIDTQSGQDGVPQNSFITSEAWTAWPLRAEWVPREGSHDEIFRFDHTVQNKSNPSAAIEDALITTTTRFAKDRFEDREWAAKEPQVKREKRDWQAERDMTEQRLSESRLLSHGESKVEYPFGTNSATNVADTTSELDEIEIESATESDVPEDIQTFSSQAFAAAAPSSSEAETQHSDSEDEKPLVSADADQTRRILLPNVRHTLSKLDDLLIGLHKARQAYASERHISRSRSRSMLSGAETTDDEKFVRSGSRASVKKRRRKRKRSRSPEDSMPERSRSRSISRSTKKRRRFRDERLGLRDWSDVLGMAALTGWDTDVVGRASERCANIFDQNMMFRIFHEKDAAGASANEGGVFFEEVYARASPTEHDVSQPPNDTKSLIQTEPPASDNEHGLHSTASPKPDDSDNLPFERKALDRSTLSCPVRSCDQYYHIYTRSTRLYDHIRQSHPEFDLDSYKKILARSSRRGKYDRSRTRSKAPVTDPRSDSD